MPRYYFSVHDGRSPIDADGTELPNGEAARLEAIRLAGSILRDEARPVARDEAWQVEAWRVEVTDEAGIARYSVAVRIGPCA